MGGQKSKLDRRASEGDAPVQRSGFQNARTALHDVKEQIRYLRDNLHRLPALGVEEQYRARLRALYERSKSTDDLAALDMRLSAKAKHKSDLHAYYEAECIRLGAKPKKRADEAQAGVSQGKQLLNNMLLGKVIELEAAIKASERESEKLRRALQKSVQMLEAQNAELDAGDPAHPALVDLRSQASDGYELDTVQEHETQLMRLHTLERGEVHSGKQKALAKWILREYFDDGEDGARGSVGAVRQRSVGSESSVGAAGSRSPSLLRTPSRSQRTRWQHASDTIRRERVLELLQTPGMKSPTVNDDDIDRAARIAHVVVMSVEEMAESLARAHQCEGVSRWLKKLYDWDFDIFQFSALPSIQDMPLTVIGFNLVERSGLMTSCKIDGAKLTTFLRNVEVRYRDNPYHNKIHACDIMLGVHYWFRSAFFRKHMNSVDLLVSIIAAACHDVDHDGHNNGFHCQTNSPLALRYNDRSVLENYHAATACELLQREDCNFIGGLSVKKQKYFRQKLINMILGTDMKNHGRHIMQLKQLVDVLSPEHSLSTLGSPFQASLPTRKARGRRVLGSRRSYRVPAMAVSDMLRPAGKDVRLKTFSNAVNARVPGILDEKEFILQCGLHIADISNPARPLKLAKDWAKRVTEEFFVQGDEEKTLGRTPSPLCDRDNANFEQSQIGFIKYVVQPALHAWHELLPDILRPGLHMERNLEWYQNELERIASPRHSQVEKPKVTTPKGKMKPRISNFLDLNEDVQSYVETSMQSSAIPLKAQQRKSWMKQSRSQPNLHHLLPKDQYRRAQSVPKPSRNVGNDSPRSAGSKLTISSFHADTTRSMPWQISGISNALDDDSIFQEPPTPVHDSPVIGGQRMSYSNRTEPSSSVDLKLDMVDRPSVMVRNAPAIPSDERLST